MCQIVNLGKWILRHLFSNLVDEVIKRDEIYRKELNENVKKANQHNGPLSIQMPTSSFIDGLGSVITPRANGTSVPMTPGMGIGVATPGGVNHLPGVPEDGVPLDKGASQTSRTSGEKPIDYFSNPHSAAPDADKKPAVTPGVSDEKPPKSPLEEKEANGKDSRFGKKFSMKSMGMPFGNKKLGRSPSVTTEKPVVAEEKVDDSSETSDNGEKEKEVDDSFYGVVQKVRNEYEKALLDNPTQEVETGITPSLPTETPVLKPPPLTTVIIQEETSGGSVDLYRGTVGTVGEDASLIEERAPKWLGELLLKVIYSSNGSLYCTTTNNILIEQDTVQGTSKGVFRAPAMGRPTPQCCRPRRQCTSECQQDASSKKNIGLCCRPD